MGGWCWGERARSAVITPMTTTDRAAHGCDEARPSLPDLAGLAASGTHARGVVVGHQRSALTPSSALRSHAPDAAP
ncbi:hypothetical protein BN2537_925 [Streptomyces venezuelae]|nr:hypothetical protein BN2537_925 [Streptomyces venezuelae]